MDKTFPLALMWFRRDLRLTDNATLYRALSQHSAVLPLFIFDESILAGLPKNDRRLTFIDQSLTELADKLPHKVDGYKFIMAIRRNSFQN